MMNYKERSSRYTKRGFTLIELLVVIAIIAVLLAILLPAMRKIKETGRAAVCKSNLRNIGLAVQMYLDDYDRKIPNTQSSNGFLWFEDDGVTYRQPGSGGGTYWGIYYKDYLKETTIFGCPSFQTTSNTRLIYSYTGAPQNSNPDFVIQNAAFGLNHHNRARGRNTNDIYRTSEFLYASDHAEPRPDGGTSDCFHNNDIPGAMNLTSYRKSQGGSRWYSYRQIFRHNVTRNEDERTGGRTNVLWLDGHVTVLEETTGDDVELRWYTGDPPERIR
jgi:prepilin-type N-terminal cleavage/methylation domain-containing protein/prepilin-type processing-associated H-X9-DG protein